MITVVDSELREQAERFAFRYSCESCLHYDSERSECANGYPTEPHRLRDLGEATELIFCKEFELG